MPTLQINDIPEGIYKAYEKRCTQNGLSMTQQMKLGEIELPPGYASSADLIREDRDNDHGHVYEKGWK